MRRAWLLVLIGIAGLLTLSTTYALTHEPAPAIRVRWSADTGNTRRTWLEMKYRLVAPGGREGRSYGYALLDTSRRNIEAMIQDPGVADTGDIDRRNFSVLPWEAAAYTDEIMWAADRLPLLRQPPVRWVLIAALACSFAAGSWQLASRYVR